MRNKKRYGATEIPVVTWSKPCCIKSSCSTAFPLTPAMTRLSDSCKKASSRSVAEDSPGLLDKPSRCVCIGLAVLWLQNCPLGREDFRHLSADILSLPAQKTTGSNGQLTRLFGASRKWGE